MLLEKPVITPIMNSFFTIAKFTTNVEYKIDHISKSLNCQLWIKIHFKTLRCFWDEILFFLHSFQSTSTFFIMIMKLFFHIKLISNIHKLKKNIHTRKLQIFVMVALVTFSYSILQIRYYQYRMKKKTMRWGLIEVSHSTTTPQIINRVIHVHTQKHWNILDRNIAKFIGHIKTYRSGLSHSYVILTKLKRFSLNIM